MMLSEIVWFLIGAIIGLATLLPIWLLFLRPQRHQLEIDLRKAIDEVSRNSEERGRLAAQKADAERRADELAEENRKRDHLITDLRDEVSKLRINVTKLETDLGNEKSRMAETLAVYQDAETKLVDTFKSLAATTLKSSQDTFLQVAETRLRTSEETAKLELEKRQKAIGDLLAPVTEHLNKLGSHVRDLEVKREGAYAKIHEQISFLQDGQRSLRDETAQLVRALRSPEGRGKWGEVQLRRVVEMAGMLKYCDFDEQAKLESEAGRRRPDMRVNLPGGRYIYVDAKTPLGAYLDAISATEEAIREEKFKQHAKQVRDHVKNLGDKEYWADDDKTPDFVVMFLPGESFFRDAISRDIEIIDDAISQKVLLTSPMSLVALLLTAAYAWRQNDIEKNAIEVAALGKELYSRMAVMADHIGKIGSGLSTTLTAYNKAVGSFETNLFPQARKFAELNIAVADERLQPKNEIEVAPRSIGNQKLLTRDDQT
jgi:DNA recombination protein RmuC